jgi:hypothetical protein
MCVVKSISNKQVFIKNELFGMSWNASVQHNKVYADDVNEKTKIDFQYFIQNYIENSIMPMYINNINENTHNNNILHIIQNVEKAFPNIVYSGKYKVGTVQKLLDLLLKYYWCLGLIAKPPHCPIDRIILTEAKIKDINWTEIQTIDQYKSIINKLRIEAKGNELSDWELEVWKRRRTTAST